MEVLSNERATLRQAVTKAYTDFDAELQKETVAENMVRLKYKVFVDKCDRLFDMDEKIVEEMRLQETKASKAGAASQTPKPSEQEKKQTKQREKIEHYRELSCEVNLRFEDFMSSLHTDEDDLERRSVAGSVKSGNSTDRKRVENLVKWVYRGLGYH